MMAAAPDRGGLTPRQRVIGLSLAALVVLGFIGANAHFFFVSFASAPDCVPHQKTPSEGAATYIAAKSSC